MANPLHRPIESTAETSPSTSPTPAVYMSALALQGAPLNDWHLAGQLPVRRHWIPALVPPQSAFPLAIAASAV